MCLSGAHTDAQPLCPELQLALALFAGDVEHLPPGTEAIADLYRVFMNYLNETLNAQKDDEKGYYVPNLSRFMKKNLHVGDLLKGKDTLKYSKAKKQLDLYMRTGDHYRLVV